MIKTSDFRTRTIFKPRTNISVEGMNPMALDIGYSSNKLFGPNIVACFPSYARKLDRECFIANNINQNEIKYRNGKTGELWSVGAGAQNRISIKDTKDSDAALYGRNRYDSEIFKIVAETGMGLALMGQEITENVYLQTGLPPTYLKQDKEYLKDALSGQHSFDINVSDRGWQHFEFDLPRDHIFVMPQLMGTFMSVVTLNNGNYTDDSAGIFQSRSLLFDPGFSTFDLLSIKESMLEGKGQTFDNLGMREVLKRTADKIFDLYNTDIPVPAMQKFLETGIVYSLDKSSGNMPHSVGHEFADILDQYSKQVCDEAIEKAKEIYNCLIEHDNLIVTGGAGAAWSSRIIEHFRGMQSLSVISGNRNDDLPHIFSNVRGYYLYLINFLQHTA